MTKLCIICKEEKELKSFYGNVSYCKFCRKNNLQSIKLYKKELRKLDHEKNKIRDNERNQKYYTDISSKSMKIYYYENKDKFQKYFAKSYYTKDGYGIKPSLIRCKSRAKKFKLSFDLDEKFLIELFKTQSGRCAVTGIEFLFDKDPNYRMRPFAASIDRINSNGGYTKDNVRFVCSIVNFSLNEFGQDKFDIMCESYIKYKKERLL